MASRKLLLCLGFLLLGLLLFAQTRFFPLDFPDRPLWLLYIHQFHSWYVLYSAPLLLLYLGTAASSREAVLLVLSLLFFGCAISVKVACLFVLAVASLYAVLRRPSLALFLLWTACFYTWIPWRVLQLHGVASLLGSFDSPNVVLIGLFYKSFERAVFCFYEVSVARVQQFSLLSLFNYMIGFPFLIGNSATPSFLHFLECQDGARRNPLCSLRQGVATCLLCLLCLLLWTYLLLPLEWAGPRWFVLAAWVFMLRFFCRRMAGEQMSVGMWRVFGYNLRDDFSPRVFLSRNFLEFWRGWNMLWREFLMSAFYYPVALRLGRRFRSQPRAVAAVAGFVTLMGAAVFDVIPQALYFLWDFSASVVTFVASMATYRLVWGILVAVNLYAYRRRGTEARWITALKILATVTTFAILRILALSPFL